MKMSIKQVWFWRNKQDGCPASPADQNSSKTTTTNQLQPTN